MLLSCGSALFARGADTAHRKWFFGAAAGYASLHLSVTGTADEMQSSFSLPNLKIGHMVGKSTGVMLYLPGSLYKYQQNGVSRDRGFEGIVPSIQYWPASRLWVMAGAGLGLDAPAFYDVEDETEAKFYFGGAALAGFGYEVTTVGRCTFDIQARAHYGYANVPEGIRTGFALNLLAGITLR